MQWEQHEIFIKVQQEPRPRDSSSALVACFLPCRSCGGWVGLLHPCICTHTHACACGRACVCGCTGATPCCCSLLASRSREETDAPRAGGRRPFSACTIEQKTHISQLVQLPGSSAATTTTTAVAPDLLSAASQTFCSLLPLCLLQSPLLSFHDFLFSLVYFLLHNLFMWN